MKSNQYVDGLRISIPDEVELHRQWRVNNAYQLAVEVEAKLA